MVMSTLFAAAGSFRDTRIRDALLARVESSNLPYNAQAAALESLGKQRQAAPFELLLEAGRRSSFNGIAQMGAFRGLAATRREEAIPALLERARYGATSNFARHAAAHSLGDIGQGQEKAQREEIMEALVDLLRDPWPLVARMAAVALQTMRAPEAIPALQAYARGLSHQNEVAVEKIITALRDEDKLDGSALKKQVEDLREIIRKLQERIESLEAKIEPGEGQETAV